MASPFDLSTLLRAPDPTFEDDLAVRGRIARGGLVTQPDNGGDPRTVYGDRLRSLLSARSWAQNNPLSMNAGPESTGPASSNERLWDFMRMQQGAPALAAAAAGQQPRMPAMARPTMPSFEADWMAGNAHRAAATAQQDAENQSYVDNTNAVNMALNRGEITLPQHAALRSRADALRGRYGPRSM